MRREEREGEGRGEGFTIAAPVNCLLQGLLDESAGRDLEMSKAWDFEGSAPVTLPSFLSWTLMNHNL